MKNSGYIPYYHYLQLNSYRQVETISACAGMTGVLRQRRTGKSNRYKFVAGIAFYIFLALSQLFFNQAVSQENETTTFPLKDGETTVVQKDTILQYPETAGKIHKTVRNIHSHNPFFEYECHIEPGDIFKVRYVMVYTGADELVFDDYAVLIKIDGKEENEDICSHGTLVTMPVSCDKTHISSAGIPTSSCTTTLPIELKDY